MKRSLKKMWLLVSSIRLLPHLALFLLSGAGNPLRKDIERWVRIVFVDEPPLGTVAAFCRLMTHFPAFRNLYYYRIHWIAR